MKTKKDRQVNFEADTKSFFRYMAKIQKEMGYTLERAVMEGARLFARSAARWTPPKIGKRLTGKKLYTRKIYPLIYEKTSRKYLPSERQKALIARNGKALKPGAEKALGIEFKVYRRIPTTSRMEKTLYPDYNAAKSGAQIQTRGLLRAGWWGSVIRLGGTVDEQYGPRVAALVGTVSRTAKEKTDSTVTIRLTNAVNEANSSEGKKLGLRMGIGKAATQMKHIVANRANQLQQVPF